MILKMDLKVPNILGTPISWLGRLNCNLPGFSNIVNHKIYSGYESSPIPWGSQKKIGKELKFEGPKNFNYQLFQGIELALVWLFELALIYIWFALVLLPRENVTVFYGFDNEGNISC